MTAIPQNAYARLTSYVRTGEASLAMAYNGMDQRVTLVSGGVTRRFVYDQDGRLLGEYGPNGSQFFAEYVWMLPEVGDAGVFGGDDGTGGWTPLAVAASNGAGASQTFQWLHTSHLGVPNGSYNASGTATTLSTITLLGFPGQTQTLADLYYNQYRDYDPTTGRYIQADPIGLAGDVNPYVYVGANPVGKADPWGLDTVVIIGSATSGNPFGHVAIAFSGRGVFSFGTGHDCGTKLTIYLADQARYRSSVVYRLRTTPAQERAMLAEIRRFCDVDMPLVSLRNLAAVSRDTCATRTQRALEAGGIWSIFNPLISPFPTDLIPQILRNGATIDHALLPTDPIPSNLSEFDP